MQWNELAWTDADGTTCRLSAEHDGRYQLEIGDATLVIGDQQALRDLQKAIELVQNDATSVLTETPPKTIPPASVAPARSVDLSFPTKVRNAIFMMVFVAIVILSIDAIRLLS